MRVHTIWRRAGVLIDGNGILIQSAVDSKYKKIEDRAMQMVKNDDRPLKIINTFENKSAAVLRLSSFDFLTYGG